MTSSAERSGYVHTTLNVPYPIPNCEAKQRLAALVLAWGTSWEPDGDVTFFGSVLTFFLYKNLRVFLYRKLRHREAKSLIILRRPGSPEQRKSIDRINANRF